jgi:ribosome biogenesis GTPase A
VTTLAPDVLTTRLELFRDRLADEAYRVDRSDLAALLEQLPASRSGRALRVVCAGETNRGKSTLVNTLVGRPLLSPVSPDVTTACWIELGYGERDTAAVLLADPDALGTPTRREIGLLDVQRYAALTEIQDAVLGVEVRLRAPLLRDLVLLDTPGVGGLQAGHSRTTLTALK